MKKILQLASVIVPFMFTACSAVDSVRPFDQRQAARLLKENGASRPSKQMIDLRLPTGAPWKKTYFTNDNPDSPGILTPANESATNWQQSIQTELVSYANQPKMTALSFVLSEIGHARANCQQVDSKILEKNQGAVSYRLTMFNCTDDINQIQIGKVFNGKDAVYSVHYSAVANKVSATQAMRMQIAILSSQLVNDPRA